MLLSTGSTPAQNFRDIMVFAADMAEKQNWNEASYRWKQALQQQPENPKVLNNLGVAAEATGRAEDALAYYESAVWHGKGDPNIWDNLLRFDNFWREQLDTEDGADGLLQPGLHGGEGKKLKGKTDRVAVELPVPPRLELSGDESLLVASFKTQETDLLDVNREVVRYLRREFRKDTELDVLEINPPPAIPEQTVEDLLANFEFWRYLGRNYEAELVVSGVVTFDRKDASAFRDVDVVNEITGQKVRRSQFVEQEQFLYVLEVFFIDGATGELRFRDRTQRGLVFQGTQNDPIGAFYTLSETIAADVLSVVTLRYRQDARVIFRR